MANEFYYCVSLSIVHPTADPAPITKSITHLRPDIEVKAGTERRGRDGELIVPRRVSPLSHWSAYCHEEERLFSGERSLSEFICECLDKLEHHRDLFATLRPEGDIKLVVGWFSESNHSADILSVDAMKKCSDLGIAIELDFYSKRQRFRTRPSIA